MPTLRRVPQAAGEEVHALRRGVFVMSKPADLYEYNVTLTLHVRSRVPPSGQRATLATDVADHCQSLTPTEVMEGIELIVMVGDTRARPLFPVS